jgi:cholesterol oxidase
MVGCRFGAKNSLDQNYLYFAEKKGAQLFAEKKVIDVRPLMLQEDGSSGYEVVTISSAKGSFGQISRFTCRGIVLAASSLGTQELLLRLKEKKSLPHISDALGHNVRTNAESLIGIRFPGSKVDLSKGVAIGSSIYIDEHTHIEPVRYPSGSSTMALLTTVMTLGRPGWTRPFAWLLALSKMLLTRPFATLRILVPFGWARETMIFLCMQTLETHLTMKLKRRWFWPFSRQLATDGDKIPTFIPAANNFAIQSAKAMGGIPMTSITEILLNVPMTAHCLGGAAMGHNRTDGVCDGKNRVFGYRNMYICDGSMSGSNLGVNPSLTIAALTERAMSHIPVSSEQEWDAIGEEKPL